jgi:hypothetical protein
VQIRKSLSNQQLANLAGAWLGRYEMYDLAMSGLNFCA